MEIIAGDIIEYFENIAPVKLAEDYDNPGLILGSCSKKIKKAALCLDVDTETVKKAVEWDADIIISHHPLIFNPVRKINGDSWKGKIIYELIRNDISVFCAHTNLDTAKNGLNWYLASILGLENIEELEGDKRAALYKLVVFVPAGSLENVRNAITQAGAGHIGNYSHCTFSSGGKGSFKPGERSNPYTGTKGKLEITDEYRLETIVPSDILDKVLEKMLNAHPYEEAAYDIYRLENKISFGTGKIGYLSKPAALKDFAATVKNRLNCDHVKVAGDIRHKVGKAAVFCGGFDGNYSGVIGCNADVLVTGDVKYNQVLEMREMGINLIDAGHFNTEIICIDYFAEIIKNKFRNIEVLKLRNSAPYIVF